VTVVRAERDARPHAWRPFLQAAACLLAVILALPPFPASATWGGAILPRVSADAAVLLDPVTGEILYAKHALDARAPASTTKIVTCLLVLENCRLDEVVSVSDRAASTGGSRVGLRSGQLIAVQDLLFGLMLRSGNDAAVALAEHVSGSVEAFAAQMTARARSLGALSSNFVNPHGLQARGHVSSAYDLALLARAALRDPVFQELVQSKEREIGSLAPEWTRLLRSTNKLLWSFSGADGVKTGTTGQAGECLVASATRSARQLISVVLHSDDRYGDSARLLEYGFEHTRLCVLGLPGDRARSVLAVDPAAPWGPVLASGRTVPLVLRFAELLAFNYPPGPCPEVEVSFSTDLNPPVLPLAAGEVVGTAVARVDGKIVASAGLTTEAPVPRSYGVSLLLAWIGKAARAYMMQGLR